jgi:calcineurin-like phosphoesterase family protein
MARILRETGIQAQGRKLVPNSFRYTFATYMRREDVVEMNEALLHAWRVTVKPNDTIINLGDITLKFIKERLTETIHKRRDIRYW